MSIPLILFVILGRALGDGLVYNLNLNVPSRRPEWAEKLSPHLAAFSIEMDRWPDWAGQEVSKPNEYFNQLLLNLGERTGHMPFLRVGANSQDRATLDLSLEVMNKTFPEPTETVAQARLLAQTFQGDRANLTKNVRLVNVELGNEPDFYGLTRTGRNGPYGVEWDVANYTNTWTQYAEAVSKEITFDHSGLGGPTLSPGAFTGFNAPEWTPAGPLQLGILNDLTIRNATTQFTEHAYSGGFDPRRVVNPGDLMNKIHVRSNMTSKMAGIQAVRSVDLDYLLV